MSSIDPLLRASLESVGKRQARLESWARLAGCWAGAGLLGILLVVIQRHSGWASSLTQLFIALVGLAAAIAVILRQRRTKSNFRDLARRIEQQNPDLNGRLLTAVQQEPRDGAALNFLQQRLVSEVLLHSRQNDWAAAVPQTRLRLALASHWLALALFGIVLWELRLPGVHSLLVRLEDSSVTVTPGDASIERGNSLVVLARFSGPLPPAVSLVLGNSPEGTRRIPLVKSLADPIFGGSVADLSSNLAYHVEYGNRRTRDFKVTVFDHPRLERADADLLFPQYTGQPAKHIPNTRRVSAVEGTQLALQLHFNKPVTSARLVAKNQSTESIALGLDPKGDAATLKAFPLAASKSYDLQLLDSDGRSNKVAAQFIFDVLTNRRPELRLASPRGDIRASPLEEVSFEGTVWDDFGVQSYGLGYTVTGKETKFVELGRSVPANDKHPFKHLLRLEELGVRPDEFVSWFIWAEDTGPDGKPRRTNGDLFFAEVRPFEEIFREGQGMEGQSQQGQAGQGTSQTDRLAQLQKQILNATWKLHRDAQTQKPRDQSPKSGVGEPRSQTPRPESKVRNPERPPLRMFAQFARQEDSGRGRQPQGSRSQRQPARPSNGTYQEDTVVVSDAQADALGQAQAAAARQDDPRIEILWANAIKEMEKALARLKAALNSPASLPEALAAEQAAYQALLKLQQHEYQVSRNQRGAQAGSAGRAQQLQQQLEQMDLTQSENRYETLRQAQSPQATERREQLQVMNRLQELARRQQDLNDRLKELQTALQEARTEQEREEIRRRLKRLQEEEQQILADVDEVRQRMDRPENQSRMADERRQLDQTREDIQRAAEAAGQGTPSQALASGTRAQRQLQEMREKLRKENSSQFAEDMRQMRAEARELARQQEEISKEMEPAANTRRKSLSEPSDRQEIRNKLAQQKQRMTNVVERATQISEQAEEAEPLLSRQLYDTLRKFNQDTSKNVKELQEDLLSRGLMTRSFFEHFSDASRTDGAKLLDLTGTMLEQDFLPQARETGRRARAAIDDLKRGVERSAESVLGDDTEALRLAEQQLDQLAEQLQREVAQAEAANSPTNRQGRGATATRGEPEGTNALASAGNPRESQQGRSPGRRDQNAAGGSENQAQSTTQPNVSAQDQSNGAQSAQASRDNQPGPGEGNPQNPGQDQNQSAQAGQANRPSRQSAQRGGTDRPGSLNNAASNERGGGGFQDFNRLFNGDPAVWSGPITGDDFGPWSDRLRDVEEMIDFPELRNSVALARDRARLMRQEFKRDRKKPDWAVVRLQVIKPLVEVRDQIADELARRESAQSLVPIDRDPVPNRYSDLVRRYYEQLGKDK